MGNNTPKRVKISVLIVYYVILLASWTVYHFFISIHINNISNGVISGLLGDGLCKNLVWTLPAFLLIQKYGAQLGAPLNDIFVFKKEHAKYLLILPAVVVMLLFGAWRNGQLAEISLTSKEIITVLFVGITEELVFRGWLLNASLPYAGECDDDGSLSLKQYAAIAINAIVFLAIHFPKWICDGVMVTNFAGFGFVSILVFSVLVSWIFIKTKSLVIPISVHMLWDLLLFAVTYSPHLRFA